jgi:hypothetical protein
MIFAIAAVWIFTVAIAFMAGRITAPENKPPVKLSTGWQPPKR